MFISYFTKPQIIVNKRFQRKFVILKAPFHFKLFKHILNYSWYRITITFTFDEFENNDFNLILENFIFLLKIYKLYKTQVHIYTLTELDEFF